MRSKPQTSNFKTRPVKEIQRPRSYVFYGRSGTGKTTIAASFPKPILLLDVRDQGTDSIMDHDEVEVGEIDSLDDVEDAYYMIKERPKAFKTVVIDTITQLQQIFMEEVSNNKRKNGRAVGDWGSMSRREFGDVAALMKEWINNFRNLTELGIRVVFIAQERTSTQEDENPDNMLMPEVGPQLFPSVATVLNANVSVIGNTFIMVKHSKIKKEGKITEKKRIVYALRVGPNPIFTTKLRKPLGVEAPSYIENATYQDIEDAINNSSGEA